MEKFRNSEGGFGGKLTASFTIGKVNTFPMRVDERPVWKSGFEFIRSWLDATFPE
jgi:hypothetical protein